MANKRSRGNPVPLIVENHPTDYDGYPFITLIQYRDDHVLTIVDNAEQKTIKAFVLDLCGPEGVDEQRLISTASQWYDHNSDRFPVSFEFSRRSMTEEVSPIYRTFNIEFVTRVIGPLPRFEMSEVKSVKRRKRKPVPQGMEVTYRNVETFEED